jgi:hypothetical protein
MMGMGLSQECHTRHEGEGFLEVFEAEFPHKSVVTFCPHGLSFAPK